MAAIGSVSLCPSLASDLAAEIESNTCPICFELMKSPDFPPIVLSPCGHSFCAKCLSVHVGSQRKKLCPYCRQKIASSAVNLSLQRLIDSFVNLQDKRQKSPQQPQTERDKEHFLNRLSAAETRSEILEKELAAAVERKKILQSEVFNINGLYRRLRHKQAEARERLRTVTVENESIDNEIRLLEAQRADIQKRVDEESASSALVDSSLKELRTVNAKPPVQPNALTMNFRSLKAGVRQVQIMPTGPKTVSHRLAATQ